MSDLKLPPHYSPAVKAGNFILTSGQLPLISRNPLVVPKTIEDQTRLVLANVEKILRDYGLTKINIVKTTAFITDVNDWGAVNKIYAEFFGDHKPARSVIPIGDLHFGCMIELEAIAHIESDKSSTLL